MADKKKLVSLLIKKCKETAKYDFEYEFALKYLELLKVVCEKTEEMKLQLSKIE